MLPPRIFKETTAIVLAKLKYTGSAQINLLLVDDKQIRSLNKCYHNSNYPTDVLAFDNRIFKKDEIIADIVISRDTVMRNAKIYAVSYKEELLRCFIHGLLHLCGYDDLIKSKRMRMFKKQEEDRKSVV